MMESFTLPGSHFLVRVSASAGRVASRPDQAALIVGPLLRTDRRTSPKRFAREGGQVRARRSAPGRIDR